MPSALATIDQELVPSTILHKINHNKQSPKIGATDIFVRVAFSLAGYTQFIELNDIIGFKSRQQSICNFCATHNSVLAGAAAPPVLKLMLSCVM